jgi:hypothetical protein
MNWEPHGKRLITKFNQIDFEYDYETLPKLQKHIQNPRNCIWCLPQELFTESVDILLDIDNNLQQQWNELHYRLNLPGKPVTIENTNISKNTRFTREELAPLYRLIYTDEQI